MGRSLPSAPKLLAVATSPWPKWCCQTLLTSTRAVSGLDGEVIARASSRRPLPWANGASSPPRIERKRRETSTPGVSGLPRISTFMGRGSFASASVWITGYLGGSAFLSRSCAARSSLSFFRESAGSFFSTSFLGTFSLSRSASDLRKPLISCVFFRIAS